MPRIQFMITQDFNASAVGILLCFVGWWQCADGATREEDLHLPGRMQLPVVSRKTPCDTSQIQHFNYQGIAYVKIDVNVPFLEVLLNSRSPCRCRNIYTFADGWTT